MHLFVLGRRDEPFGGLGLIYPMIAANLCAARLEFSRGRTQGARSALRMLQPTAILDRATVRGGGAFFRTSSDARLHRDRDVRLKVLHEEAPFKTSAIWMYFIGKPARSAHPC